MTVSFHLETTGLNSKKLAFKQATPLGEKTFEKSPILQTSDFIAANCFPSPDDPNFYGVVFQIKPSVSNRFKNLTSINRGKYLIAMANGRVIDFVRVNQTNPDDKICIWRNISLQEVHTIKALVPRIGEPKADWKKRLKAEAKAAKRRS